MIRNSTRKGKQNKTTSQKQKQTNNDNSNQSEDDLNFMKALEKVMYELHNSLSVVTFGKKKEYQIIILFTLFFLFSKLARVDASKSKIDVTRLDL